MIKNTLKISSLAALLLLFLSCSSKTDVAGSGSDTEVTGIIMLSGKPVEGAIVSLYPEGFVPNVDDSTNAIAKDTTDADGRYQFRISETGTYNIMARIDTLSVIEQGIDISGDSTITIPNLELRGNGILTVIIPTIIRNYSRNSQIFIEGTDLKASFNFGDDSVTFSEVPTETPLRVLCTYPSYTIPFVIDSSILVPEGETVTTCHTVRALILVDTANQNYSHTLNLEGALEDSFTDITVRSIHLFDTADLSGMDVAYLAADVDSLYGYTDFFMNTSMPLVVASSDLFPVLGMTTDTNWGSEDAASLFPLTRHGTFPDTSDATTSISLFDPTDSIPTVEWGIPEESAFMLAISGGVSYKRSYYFYYYPGDEMANNTFAKGYRIGLFGTTDYGYSEKGNSIIRRVLHWMGEESDL